MFENVQDAFNHYRNHSLADIEKRAAEIKGTINSDPEADITNLNVEIEGLNEAKKNKDEKRKDDKNMDQRNFNPITGTNFNQEVPTDNIFESREYRSAFYKTLLGQDLSQVEQRTFDQALTEQRADFNTTGNSAAVLPTETLNEVVKKARKKGGLLSVVRNFNLPVNISVPIGTPADKATWHSEGAEVNPEQVKTVKVKFDGHELIKVFSISVSTKKMSIAAFEQYLTEELSNTVLEAIADALVNGDGNGKGKGLESIDLETVELAGKYTDFTNAMAAVKSGYASGAKWAMNHSTLYKKVYGVTDDNGRPIFVEDPKNEAVGHILGKEVVIDDHIADDVIYLGDYDYLGVNLAQDIMIEVSRESSFRSGLVDYRAIAIADCKPLVDEAFVKMEETVGA